jgi:tRNA(Ile2) C34 agmatinyltransferase TiaS
MWIEFFVRYRTNGGLGTVAEVFAMVPKRQADNPHCSTCNDEMELTVIIPPFGSPYGLEVYTCPKCGRSEDHLIMVPKAA